MSNPLLQPYDLPPFSSIRAEHVKPAIEQVLADSRARLASLLDNPPQKWTWANLIEPLDDLGEQVSRAWSPVSHLNAVMNTPELRDAYNSCLPLLSEFKTEMGQNQKLFEAYRQLSESDDFAALDQAQQTIIGHALRDFRLSGIALPAAQQKRYGEMKLRLSDLQSRFSNQLMDATQAWSRHITDADVLDGLPESAMAQAQQAAQAKQLEGWLINLEFPSYFAVMTYAHDRALREEVYTAYCTRASDQGPHAGENDNGPLIDEILELRQELAALLGYANYAELSLATKMAESTDQVVGFLRDLGQRSRSFAEQDLQALRDFAAQNGCPDLQSWDMGYYSEQLRQHLYAISQEELKPYFPIDRVLQGMFGVVEKLYGIQLRETQDFDRWHPDARLFEVVEQGEVTGRFFLDLYARSHKRGGAWMDGCRDRRRLPGGALQRPVAYLVSNFAPPVAAAAVGSKPALLTHDEVTTLFHEFGHGLHHLLTQVDYPSASGINGVAWDAVELPSQFMENWCWEPEGLALISGHFETHAPLPQSLLDKMLAARNFQSGLGMLRQVEFSLFDFLLHRRDYPALSVQQVLDKVRDEVAVFRPPNFNRFQNGFSHIFAGGYAAGYYSYKWAEVLSADAFSRFEEEGVLNADTGRAFRENILERGGSREPMELFVAFRGREPSIDALLRHSGLTGEAA